MARSIATSPLGPGMLVHCRLLGTQHSFRFHLGEKGHYESPVH